MNTPSFRQQGAALIVSLIMLILISLLAVASFRLGKSDLQIVGNMQQRKQALSAAQQTIEQVISSTQFTATPTNAVFNPCTGQNTACVDVNGDGVPDVNVSIVVLCNAIQPILNSALNFSNSNDTGCLITRREKRVWSGTRRKISRCSWTQSIPNTGARSCNSSLPWKITVPSPRRGPRR